MNNDPIIPPDLLRSAELLTIEREKLCKNQPACPKCRTHQVQIIDATKQEWKCRECKHTFFTNYNL